MGPAEIPPLPRKIASNSPQKEERAFGKCRKMLPGCRAKIGANPPQKMSLEIFAKIHRKKVNLIFLRSISMRFLPNRMQIHCKKRSLHSGSAEKSCPDAGPK